MKSAWEKIFLILILVLVGLSAMGQKTNRLPIQIKESLTLNSGIYVVKGTHYIKRGADLIIKSGVNLVFEKDAAIRVDGGLQIIGEANNLVTISSLDKNKPGNGFVINGVSSNQNIILDYVRFNHIKKPISFEFRWSRESVAITNSVIKNSNYEGAAVEVRNIDNLLTEDKILFTFKNNTFCNSTSSLLFSNITSDLLTVEFDNNVLTRNQYTGRSRNGIFTSPLYLTYNKYQRNDIATLDNNAIFDNFYSMYYEDTFEIGRTNISVIGSADDLDLSGNYFGGPSNHEIEETFDFISANYRAPFLFYNDALNSPPDYLNGHFYSVLVNNKKLDEKTIFSRYRENINSIEMKFNRSVIDRSNFGVFYHYLDFDTVRSVRLRHSLKYSENNTILRISVTEKIQKLGNIGYIEVEGLYDYEGKDVPTLQIGKKGLIKPEFNGYIPGENIKENATNDTLNLENPIEDVLLDSNLLNSNVVHIKNKYWDWGIFAGNSLYFGDVNQTSLSMNPRNMKPNFGLRWGYQATEKWRVGFSSNSMLISGSDRPLNTKNNNVRGTNFERNLSFRTTIVDASILLEHNLWKYEWKTTYVPSIHGGINAYYFKPMAKIAGDDTWYDLRSVGTEGQTLNGANNQYSKVNIGIPFGISLKRHFKQNLIVSLSYTYNKLFTDYLDDISTGKYPASQDIMDANPNLGVKAANLSNPSNQAGNRSSSANYDGYGYWGLTFYFKLDKKRNLDQPQ